MTFFIFESRNFSRENNLFEKEIFYSKLIEILKIYIRDIITSSIDERTQRKTIWSIFIQ